MVVESGIEVRVTEPKPLEYLKRQKLVAVTGH